MTKTLISVEDPTNSHYLIKRLEENYLIEAIPNEKPTPIDKKYEYESPDMVLIEFNNENLIPQIQNIYQFDSTACIVAMIDEEHEDLIPIAYKAGVKSVIKYYPKLDRNNCESLTHEINRICNIVQRNGKCLLCWRETKFSDKYHDQKALDLAQSLLSCNKKVI